MIRGINHITLAVVDLERSFRFYREVLGLKPLARWKTGAYFLAGETWFCLSVDSRTRTEPVPDYTHVAFTVAEEEFAAVERRIRESEATLWKENSSEGASLYFLDPDHHKLEIHVGDWRSRLRDAQADPWDEEMSFF